MNMLVVSDLNWCPKVIPSPLPVSSAEGVCLTPLASGAQGLARRGLPGVGILSSTLSLTHRALCSPCSTGLPSFCLGCFFPLSLLLGSANPAASQAGICPVSIMASGPVIHAHCPAPVDCVNRRTCWAPSGSCAFLCPDPDHWDCPLLPTWLTPASHKLCVGGCHRLCPEGTFRLAPPTH